MTDYINLSKARRPGREVQRVNVDFPKELLQAIDEAASRVGVSRQAFIKIRLADILAKNE
jgi:metal-responsive CopG/Arc/MetJ family transcriptional regulator